MARNEAATRLANLPSAIDRWRIKLMLQEQGIHVIDATDPGEDDYIAGPALYCLDSEVQ